MRRIPLATCLVVVVVSAGCADSRTAPGHQAVPEECTACHGSAASVAPPVDTKGSSDPVSRGVGAHAAHLAGGTLGVAVPCSTCHVVPATVKAPGHLDHPRPAGVVFSGLAVHGGAVATIAQGSVPVDEKAPVTCSGVYCHGATLKGGKATEPVWNGTASAYTGCDACHGYPPPAPHPAGTGCSSCHGDTVGTDGKIADADRHIDGKVDLKLASACNACHGGDENSAPPKDTAGRTDPALPSVGAHQTHLKGSARFAAVACSECHAVPAPGSLDHVDGKAAPVFGSLATADGTAPVWTTPKCSGIYCHGATLGGGTLKEPDWTKVDGTQAACGTCHGNPPPAPHIQSAACGQCHGDTVGVDGAIAHPDRHGDGKVDVSSAQACNACHGSDDNSAPPKDTAGNTATDLKSVGAHQAHLKASGLSAAVACKECHPVPLDAGDAGHLDGATQVVFGTLAAMDGAVPAWDASAATCSATYCHGGTLSGGSVAAPVWTKVDGTQIACGSCHGMPPSVPHPAATNCRQCHGDTIGTDGQIAHPEKHIDGIVQAIPIDTCNACHGSPENAAPPKDLAGNTATTVPTVGAHQAHVNASALSSAIACSQCHKVPASVDSPGHLDAEPGAELTFGPLAIADGAAPAFDPSSTTCSGVYCHGSTLKGGTLNAPSWTQVDGSQDACGSCHGNPPPAPHAQDTQCEKCHSATAGASGTIANPAMHVDGTVQVDALACNACHGSAENAAPPKDTDGASDTTLVTVGAHQAHLKAADLAAPVACTECHVVPGAIGDAGHLDNGPTDVSFGKLAKTDGANPSWSGPAGTCSGVYCHGGTLGGGSNKQPLWTKVDGSQDACGSCHGLPPTGGAFPHAEGAHKAFECSICHTTVNGNRVIILKAQHINGVGDAKATAKNCTMAGCHD